MKKNCVNKKMADSAKATGNNSGPVPKMMDMTKMKPPKALEAMASGKKKGK